MSETAVRETRWMQRRSAEMVGAGVGFLAGAALGLMGRPERRPTATAGTRGADLPGVPVPDEEPVVYEFRARVVWSDVPGFVTSDLEDAEDIEGFLNEGWELINVIVPFAQTTQLDLSYPGNTRKLIAYFRRPVREGTR